MSNVKEKEVSLESENEILLVESDVQEEKYSFLKRFFFSDF